MPSELKHRHPLDPLYDQFADVFQALASPKRLHILRCLSEREKSVSEILACKAFTGVHQSTVSQNLAALRQQGLVKARRDGTNIFYKLSDPRIADMLSLVGDMVKGRTAEIRMLAETDLR